MIGIDLTPNTYIDSVSLYDNYIEGSTYCVDNLDGTWSSHSTSMKYFKFMVVTTQSDSLASDLQSGGIAFDPKELKKSDPHVSVSFYPLKSITPVMNNGMKVFKVKFKHHYNNALDSLSVFVAIVVDPVQVAGARFGGQKFIVGSISSEQIIDGGQLVSSAVVFTLPDGTQWTGPVHLHPTKGYMQFSKHADIPHALVTPINVTNLKIKDLRKKKIQKNSISSANYNQSIHSKLYPSFDTEGRTKAMFFLNLKQLIAQKTKYGNVFLSANQSTVLQMLKSFRFSLIKINRKLVKTSYQQNKLKVSNVKETKNILTAFETDTGFNVTSGNSSVQKTFFPFDRNVVTIEFSDFDANTKLGGEYFYDVTLLFKDPTVKMARSIIAEIKDAKKSLDRYNGRIKRFLKSVEAQNNPPQNWIDSELLLFGNDLKNAPWIKCSKVYSKYTKMFFKTTETLEKLQLDSLSHLDPRSFTASSINRFRKRFDLLSNFMNSIFDVKTSDLSNYSVRSMPKSSFVSNLIEIKISFKEIIEPSKNNKFFNVIEFNEIDAPFTNRLSLNEFKSRMNLEFVKFYEEKQLSTQNEFESEIKNSMASYFTPIAMKKVGDNKISLAIIPDIDKVQFAKFFDEIPKTKKRRKALINKKSKFTVLPNLLQPVVEKERYVEASDYLGDNSNLLSEVNPVMFSKLKEESETIKLVITSSLTRSKAKPKSKFVKNLKNKTFMEQLINRAPTTSTGRRLMPIQLRSLDVEEVPFTKDNFEDSDVLSADNDLITSVNYFTITQVEYLVDFNTSPNGVKDLGNPIWEIVDDSNLEDLAAGSFCRIRRINSAVANIERDDRVELPFSNRFFIITDEELPSNLDDLEDIDDQLETIFSNTIDFDIAGVTSNIIEQNPTTESQIFNVKIEEFTIEQGPTTVQAQGVPRTRVTAPTQATPVVASTITGPTFTGGGGGGY